ncbi:MAG TPA: TerC family protein [Planctomycetota bacterium]|nr:TerC family protein [Planctomycetota bacterium]
MDLVIGSSSIGTPWLWSAFLAFVLVMLALDLGVFHRKSHVVGFREALVWSAVWIALALIFCAFVWTRFGETKGKEFLQGYLLEKALSVDNIFVFVLIFRATKIPLILQHRVLYWGILTALVLRAVMIFAGVELIERFEWMIFVLGAFLVFTGAKLFAQREEEMRPEDTKLMQWAKRTIRSTPTLEGDRFFVKRDGRNYATPMFLALLMVEFTDVVFAVDSIPAILGVTVDQFVVFTSNIFAILGLRSLFFCLAGMMDKFRYLKVGLAGILVFIGLKMCCSKWVHVDHDVSLGVILGLLTLSVAASLVASRRDERREREAAASKDAAP